MTAFTVVLPTRDRAERLRAAAESVLEQSLDALELVIVDDGSTDHTAEICEQLADFDPRVRVVSWRAPKGAAAARNGGIRLAVGEFVAFIDDDCVWHPDRLRRIRTALAEHRGEIGYVCTQTLLIGEAGSRYRINPVPDGSRWPPWRVGTPMMVVRRDLLRSIGGFDERLRRAQDMDLAIRVVSRTEGLFLVEPLVWKDDVPGISSDPVRLAEASRHLARKYARPGALPFDLHVAFHRSFAHKLLVHGLWREGVRHHWRAARLAPLRVRSWGRWLVAVCGLRPYLAVTRGIEIIRRRTGQEPLFPDPADTDR